MSRQSSVLLSFCLQPKFAPHKHTDMNLILFLRRYILCHADGKPMTQLGLAKIIGCSQVTVLGWERDGSVGPRIGDMAKVRTHAQTKGLPWQDRWMFEVPGEVEAERLKGFVLTKYKMDAEPVAS